MRRAGGVVFGAFLTLFFFGCRTSEEEHVKELPGMKLQYSADDFVVSPADHGSARCAEILAERSKTDLSRALLFSALSEHKDVIKILLDNGAEIDSRSPDGSTALILAASKGNKEIVNMLLQAGADPSLTTQTGATAESTAAAKGFREIAEFLHGRIATKPAGTAAVVSGSPSSSPSASVPLSSPSNAISDADILRQPGPVASGSPSLNPKLDQNPSSGLATKIAVLEVQEAFLPVTLQEVQSK